MQENSPILTVELQKNGDIIDQVDLPHHRCYMALVMDQALVDSQKELEENQSTEVNAEKSSRTTIVAEVIATCPMYPGVTAEHFPLGSALLYRAEMSSQWTLGQVTFFSNKFPMTLRHIAWANHCCLNYTFHC